MCNLSEGPFCPICIEAFLYSCDYGPGLSTPSSHSNRYHPFPVHRARWLGRLILVPGCA